ncbi:MAG: sigma 54-interacting transcriptional regulator [Opitutaceae bacterium]|jgi:DNA-binding NtrC family response regulator
MSADSKGPLAGCEAIVVEDDAALRKRLAAHLGSGGAAVSGAGTLAEARRLLRELRFDFAVVDLNLPDGEGLELLREHAFSENTGVVVMTAFGGVKKAVEAMRLGAGDYLAKPFEPEELVLAFLRCRGARAAARRDEKLADEHASETDGLFFGEGLSAVRARLDTILATDRRLERNLPPVLIEGETGTGKTVLARWLHRRGPRVDRPFIAINCAALPDTLVESELFGHERGAFTDARQARIGLFEAADGGTLFLDEISSLTAATQSKILTAVEGGTIRRVGGPGKSRSTQGSSSQATAPSPTASGKAPSARISISASTFCGSPCRRFASARPTSCLSPAICWPGSAAAIAGRGSSSPRPWRRG